MMFSDRRLAKSSAVKTEIGESMWLSHVEGVVGASLSRLGTVGPPMGNTLACGEAKFASSLTEELVDLVIATGPQYPQGPTWPKKCSLYRASQTTGTANYPCTLWFQTLGP